MLSDDEEEKEMEDIDFEKVDEEESLQRDKLYNLVNDLNDYEGDESEEEEESGEGVKQEEDDDNLYEEIDI